MKKNRIILRFPTHILKILAYIIIDTLQVTQLPNLRIFLNLTKLLKPGHIPTCCLFYYYLFETCFFLRCRLYKLAY